MNKLKQANAQNWYHPKVAILDSFSLIRLFVLSFTLISLSFSLEISSMRSYSSLLSLSVKDVLKLFNVAGAIKTILI